MAGRDKDETDFHTTQEESMRQAEAAFGGASSDAPPLPGLGDGSPSPAAAQPSSAPAPASAPAPVRPSSGGIPPSGLAPTGAPGALPRRRRSLGCSIGLVAVFGVIAAVAGGIYALVNSVSDTVDKVRSSPGFSVPSVPGVPSIPTPSPPEAPSGGASYFTIGGLAAAKAKAQGLSGPSARIQLARIADGQLQVIARNGRTGRVILISPGVTRRIDTPSGTVTGNEFRFAALRSAAVGRITSALNRRFHISRGEIDYMVVLRDPIEHDVEWLIYPRGGSGHFQANAAGGGLRRVG